MEIIFGFICAFGDIAFQLAILFIIETVAKPYLTGEVATER